MIEERKCGTDIMKKTFYQRACDAKEDDEGFENYTKCWICNKAYVEGHVKVRDHCHIIVNYRGSSHRYCNIKIKLNHKIPIVFNNLMNCD